MDFVSHYFISKKAPDSFAQLLCMHLIFTNMSDTKFVYLTDMPHGTVMKKGHGFTQFICLILSNFE